MLCTLRDPGPMTNSQYGGSEFLCPENDDATAEPFATQLDDAGRAVSTILPWNTYPWYINGSPRAAESDTGVEPLQRLLGLLPTLQVVILLGGSARGGWRRLVRRHPEVALQLEGRTHLPHQQSGQQPHICAAVAGTCSCNSARSGAQGAALWESRLSGAPELVGERG